MLQLLMPLRGLFEYVDAFESSIAIRESQYLYPALLTSHVVSLMMFAGLIFMMDLRLLGVGNMQTPFSQLQRRLFPYQMVGMVFSAITGVALVYAQPMRFYLNIFFWVKMFMMAIAGLNAMAFHYLTYNSVSRWDKDPILPPAARLAGALGLALWTAVVVSGRLIAYNWFQ
jgi:hypothetical protein